METVIDRIDLQAPRPPLAGPPRTTQGGKTLVVLLLDNRLYNIFVLFGFPKRS